MELEQAIRFALQEEDRPAAGARPQGPASGTRLTRRQMEIARLVGEGLTNREIAQRLFISERTAEGHVEQIRNKLGFSSRVQIAAWIVENERRG
jgi:DNA-binding CsgD family transcriptional regulator